MKKTLIALAVAASAVSGMAHAWTRGDFNGTVDIGGKITANDYRQKWEWSVGSSIDGFNNSLSELTNGGKTLTIAVQGNKPILLGKTIEAFAAPVIGGVGAIPKITFTDFQGNVIQVNGIEHSDAGLGFLPIPMKDAAGNAIGTAKVNITFAGFAGVGGDNPAASETGLRSLYARPNVAEIFTGGMPSVSAERAEIEDGTIAANTTALFGSLSAADALAQVQAVKPNVTSLAPHDKSGTENMKYTDGNVVSAAYALGIADGQTIEATFDNALTASTEWHAPLNVAITYN